MSPFLTTFLPILGTFLNYLEFHNAPSVLVTNLCLPLPQIVDIHQFILQSNRPMLIHSINSLAELNEPNGHQALVLINLACPGIKKQLMNSTKQLNLNYRWFLVNSEAVSSTEERALEIFSDIPILQMSEIYYPVAMGSNLVIKRVYRNSASSRLIQEIILQRNLTDQTPRILQSEELSTTAVMRRMRSPVLDGAVFQAAVVITFNDTINHLEDFIDVHIDAPTKVSYIITVEMMRFLNATAEYKFVPSWGYMDNETGTYDGMIGMLMNNEAQIGATVLFPTLERMKVVQYVSMTSLVKVVFLFRAPNLSTTDNVFVLPFKSVTWIVILITVVLFIPALKMASLADTIKSRTTTDSPTTTRSTSWNEIFMLIVGAICTQGSSFLLTSLSARILILVVFVTLMLIHTSFEANIVGLIQSPSTRIRTLNDLLHSSLRVGIEDTVYNRYYFPHQTEPIRKAIYEEKVLRKDGSMAIYSTKEGIELVRKGMFAFHLEVLPGYKVVAETFQEEEKCGLKEMNYLGMIDPWYAIQRDSPLRKMITVALFRLREHGIQERINNLIYTKKPQCHGTGGGFVSVGLVDVKSAFIFLAAGFLLAVLILLIEILYLYLERLKDAAAGSKIVPMGREIN